MDTINSKIMTKMHTLRMTGVEPANIKHNKTQSNSDLLNTRVCTFNF